MQPVTLNGGFGHLMDAMAANQKWLAQAMKRLSTGLRVSQAQDDPAASAVANRWRAQSMGFDQAVANIQTAQGMLGVAQDGLNALTSSLQRIRSLAVRSADASLNDSDRKGIQQEIDDLVGEIDRRAQNTTYNRRHLLDGTFTPSMPDPTTITTPSNDLLQSGQHLLDTVQKPTVQGKYNSQTFKFTVVHNADGGLDAQVYDSRSADPNKPIDRIVGLDRAGVTRSLGPNEVARVATGANASDVAVDQNRKLGYVANYGSDTVSIVALNQGGVDGGSTLTFVNRADNAIEKSIDVGSEAAGLALTPDGTQALVTSAGDGTLRVVDLGSETVAHTVAVGNATDGALTRRTAWRWIRRGTMPTSPTSTPAPSPASTCRLMPPPTFTWPASCRAGWSSRRTARRRTSAGSSRIRTSTPGTRSRLST